MTTIQIIIAGAWIATAVALASPTVSSSGVWFCLIAAIGFSVWGIM